MLFRNNSFVLLPEGILSAQASSAIPQQQDNKDHRAEIDAALQEGGVDRIMLDNFTPEATREAVQYIREHSPKGQVNWDDLVPNWKKANPGYIEIESSGGITADTLRQYAECGVDFISVGALTHSFKCLDMSFKAYKG